MNDTVVAYRTALVDDDPDRFGVVSALGLDEVLMVKVGPRHRQEFSTQIVDVVRGQRLLAEGDREAVRTPQQVVDRAGDPNTVGFGEA